MLLMVSLVMSLLYLLLQAQYIYFWRKTAPFTSSPAFVPTEGVSIIVAARNEAENITECLQQILEQHFPRSLMQVLVIDDHSTDGTVPLVRTFQDERIQLISLKDHPEFIKAPAYKKSAISLGVELSRFDQIVVTDADCRFGPDWLQTLSETMESKQSAFLAAPVAYYPGQSLLEQMQEMEMTGLMLITASGIQSGLHALANGANMMFKKETFLAVNGYDGNEHYASGDDLFLIEKIKKAYPDRIAFVKSTEAAAFTFAKKDWSSFTQQRLRWAGKNKGLRDKTISLIWLFVGGYHLFMILTFLAALFQVITWFPFLVMLSFKWVADFYLLQTATSFFNRLSVLRQFAILQIMYTGYVAWMAIALSGGRKASWAARDTI